MSSKPADEKPADTATRETGETAGGETTERATVADSAAEQRDADPEPAPAARRGASLQGGETEDGVATADEQRGSAIAALLRERRGYVARVNGATEQLVKDKFSKRLAGVDAALKALGATPPKS